MKIWNIIMVAVTAIVFVMAVMYAATGTLPFGMDQKPDTDAYFTLVGLFLMAFFYLLQTILGFLTIGDHKKGPFCNVIGLLAWVEAVIMFLAVFGDDASDWIMLFVLIIPAAFQSSLAQNIGRAQK